MEASTVAGADAAAPARQRFAGFVWRAIQPDVPFYLLIGIVLVAALGLNAAFGYPKPIGLKISWRLMFIRSVIYALPALAATLAWAVVRQRRSLREPATWLYAVRTFFEPARTLGFLLLFVTLPIFMAAFVAFKASIPDVSPFAWDVRLMLIDRLLHFGHEPWTILHSFLGSPPATVTIDLVYSLWFPILILTVIWQAWHGSHFSDARAQFLLAYAGCWIVGGILLATFFSSAGPVYYASVVGGPDPFAPLMDYLHRVNEASPLTSLWVSDLLWQSYVNPGPNTMSEGISAMPSMHVSMAVLMAFLGFRVNRFVGIAYTAFAGLILLGSVHLAWHYAIDGYAAAAVTAVIWWCSGRAVAAWEKRTASFDQPIAG